MAKATSVEAAERGEVYLFDLLPQELEALLAAWGEPAYRARQLFRWLHGRYQRDPEGMTDLPKGLRRRLAGMGPLGRLERVLERVADRGETRKGLFRFPDGAQIEAVWMRYPDRRTLCLSTQVGCAIGCPFCATGTLGLTRNLSAGEMVEQVYVYAHDPDRGVTNLVFMGMGEPFHNYDATLKAVRILNHPLGLGLGARHMTISTSGVVPEIRRLAEEGLQVTLAISLHAPDDELRNELVPLNRAYPLKELLAACRAYVERTRRRITFEYVLLEGVNDRPAQARALARLLKGEVPLHHVNLIPWNPVSGLPYRPTPPEGVRRFARILREAGVNVTVRRERGQEIQAACGQLRLEAGEALRLRVRRG